MQAPTQEETTSARKILIETDPDSRAVLTHDAGIARLFPRLRLPKASNQDGTMSTAMDTFDTAWRVIDTSQEGFMRVNQVTQLVRLMGYAQTGEVIAGADLGDISNMLRKPGPSARIYGWTVPEGKSFDKSPSPDEAVLTDAILMEGGKYEYGVLDGEAAREVFRRSGLDNRTLAVIWELVDETERGFLEERGVLRMLRLISCAQRGLRLHARLYESPCPMPDLDDSFISAVVSTPEPVSITTTVQAPLLISGPPSFPVPQFTINPGGIPGLTSRSILPSNPSTPQMPIMPTRPLNDPLPPLTEKERTAFMAIFDRNDPQGGVISGAQGIQVLSRSQLPTHVLAQIWDLADSDRSGSLSRSEFVIAMYLVKLLMDRRRANPGREEEQMPSEVPLWLRAEAARVEVGTVNGLLSLSTGVVAAPNGTGLSQTPGTLSLPVQYARPDGPPPPSLLDLDNDPLPSPPAVWAPPSTRPPPNGSLQSYLNRPVPATPPQLEHRRSEDAPPPYVELDNNLAHSRVRSVS